MSCDNIAGNGRVAATMFGAFARLRDAALGAWVESQVHFPDSMVDRITPATTDEDRALVTERFGIADGWPVVCEPFTQWVLVDEFGHGRPPLEDVGVQIVEDVEPYELMKLRLLNAGHQAIGYLGYLAGHRYAHDVCQDPLFVRFLRSYMDREATPTLPDVPGIDLDGYKRTLIERFANPHVADTLARLCVDGSERIPTFLLPVIRHQLATGGEIDRSALVVAAWARYAEGVDEEGCVIDVVDRRADALRPAAARQRDDLTAFLGNAELFGDLTTSERFVAAFSSSLRSLHERGARATAEHLVG
jgi:mannitol 2-dehydrogenase